MSAALPLLVVDAANVVGSVPDKWWLDREGATIRLRDALAAIARTGTLSSESEEVAGLDGPVDLVLVVEGAARNVPSSADVRVVAAAGSGDDAIVELVRAEAGSRPCVVVTADRGLRARVVELGARVLGPRAVRRA